MATAAKILAFAGSTRTGSFNKKLIKVATDAAQKAGAQVTLIDLKDLAMPLYDGDLENKEGLPANALKFKELLLAHDGLLISAPEYNGNISAVLKNAFDWASRSLPNEAPFACFLGKTAAIMSASPGALGGLRGLVHVRALLGDIRILVIPEQVAISKADQAFDDEGKLKDPKQQQSIEALANKLVTTVTALKK